jgi:hypothetical protein
MIFLEGKRWNTHHGGGDSAKGEEAHGRFQKSNRCTSGRGSRIIHNSSNQAFLLRLACQRGACTSLSTFALLFHFGGLNRDTQLFPLCWSDSTHLQLCHTPFSVFAPQDFDLNLLVVLPTLHAILFLVIAGAQLAAILILRTI